MVRVTTRATNTTRNHKIKTNFKPAHSELENISNQQCSVDERMQAHRASISKYEMRKV